MKNHLITLLFLGTFLPHLAFGQWTPLPSGTDQDLFAIDFVDAQHGAAVGNNSTILITSDGGSSWTPANTGEIRADFRSVYMISPDTILAGAGSRFDGMLYRSTDGGQQWEPLIDVSELTVTSLGIIGFDEESVYYSTDLGDSWDTTDLEVGNTVLMEAFQFADDNTGYLSGNVSGFLTYSTYGFRTEDGGRSWAPLWVFDLPNANALTSLATPDPDTAYLFTNEFVNFLPGTENQVVRLTDFYFDASQNRDSWRFKAETANNDMPGNMISSHFLDGTHGFAGSLAGDLFQTEDGGEQWTLVYDGDTSIFEIIEVDAQLLYAVGGNGLILKYALNTQTSERQQIEPLSFYPNPVRTSLFLHHFPKSTAKAALYSIDGRFIRNFQWTPDTPIEVADLPAGTYLLELQSGESRFQGRFLKQ